MRAARRFTILFAASMLSLAHASAGCAQAAAGTAFRSGGTRLVYYQYGRGDGHPLVMVAGGPGFDHDYLRVGDPWRALEDGRRIIFYDQRGTGRADPVRRGDTATVADYVADLEALRVALGAEQIDLLGHSFGGYLAMAYGVAHPRRVSRLVLVDAAAPRPSDTEFLFSAAFPDQQERYGQWSRALSQGDSAQAAAQIDAYLSMLFYSPERRDAWMRDARGVGFNAHPARLLWNPAAGPDLTDSLRVLSIPTLVVNGRYDMNVSPRTAWRIHRLIPDSRLVLFEESGHLPFYEEPGRFMAVLRDFLEEMQPPAGAGR